MSRARIRLTPMRRHLAAIVTLALSTGFVAVMVLAGGMMTSTIRATWEDKYAGISLVADDLRSGAGSTPSAPPEVPGARAVWHEETTGTRVSTTSGKRSLLVFERVPPTNVRAPQLASGRAATAKDEVVLSSSAARQLGVEAGATLRIPAPGSETGQVTLKVTGIAAPTRSEALGIGGMPTAQLTPANRATVLGGTELGSTRWLVSLEPGADPGPATAALKKAGFSVRTGEQAVQEQVNNLMAGMAALGAILGVFVAIALVTAAVVVSNTLSVTFAQRTRTLALMRAVGATRGQVGRVVLRESFAVGLIGALIGMLGAHLLAQGFLLLAWAIGWLHGFVALPFSLLSIVLPLVAGAVVTVLAGLMPLLRSVRVTPMQALRRDGGERASRRIGALEIVGAIVAVLGFAAMAAGVAISLGGNPGLGVAAGVLGGIVSLAGVLMAISLVAQPLARIGGAVLGRIGGLPARLAATSVLREKRRSAATVAALLIGTSLMTMMSVGASTAKATLEHQLNSARPCCACPWAAAPARRSSR